MPTEPHSQLYLIQHATLGFDHLLNNSLPEAKAVFAAHSASPFHLVGRGLSSFLQAALGQEDTELLTSLSILTQAEHLSAAHAAAKRPKSDPQPVFPAGTEYKIIVADAVISQALCHILTESYVEFMKAIYKLNRAYKGFSGAYKIVFPHGVQENESLATVFAGLNERYLKAKSKPETTAPSSFFGWNTKKRNDLAVPGLRHSASTSALEGLAPPAPAEGVAVSVPTSRSGSRSSSLGSGEAVPLGDDGDAVPAPLWAGDPLSTLVISGAAFGFGLFGLIFSLLPPKLRKLISWFGFSNANRTVALKLLTIASSTGDDVHGYFASLTLVSYYQIILLMSGYQAQEQYLIQQTEMVLSRVSAKFPDGSLWVLNRAKLCRMKNDVASAIEMIEEALEKDSTFREADSLLVFELSWCYLSDARWESASASFLRMRELNNWSHATYILFAAGALLEIPAAERTSEMTAQIDTLLEELPSLFGLKRVLGEPPSTEIFIARKVASWTAKHARWVASGRLAAETKYSEAIRISPASELGLFWNTTGRAPHAALQVQIDHLSALSPPPRFGPLASSSSHPASPTAPASPPSIRNGQTPVVPYTPNYHLTDDLDSPDEIATRDLLLGTMYRSLGDPVLARQFLQAAIDAAPKLTEDRWVTAFAMFDLAVLECFEADREAARASAEGDGGNSEAVKDVWRKAAKHVEHLIAEVFAFGEYDLKSRLEGRVGMLRDQVAERKANLCI